MASLLTVAAHCDALARRRPAATRHRRRPVALLGRPQERVGRGRRATPSVDGRAERERAARGDLRGLVDVAPREVAEQHEGRRPQARSRRCRTGRKRANDILDAPATNGAIARTIPMKRPMRIVIAAAAREEALDLAVSRSSVIWTFGPCSTRKSRPSLRPSQKRHGSRRRRSAAHTSGSRIASSRLPCPAKTPPAMTAVSPGATSPTNAPVSRKARPPTSRYAHLPIASPMSSSSSSTFGSSTTPKP